MQITIYVIIGVLLTITDYFIFENNKKFVAIIKKLLGYTIFFNIILLGVVKYIFNVPYILKSSLYTPIFSFKYAVLGLILGSIFFIFKGILTLKISFKNPIFTFTKNETKFSKSNVFIKLISTLLFIIGMIFIFFSYWFINYLGEITPEQFLFNLKSPLSGTSTDSYIEILNSLYLVLFLPQLYFYFL